MRAGSSETGMLPGSFVHTARCVLLPSITAFQSDMIIHTPVVLLASLYHNGIPSPLAGRHRAAGKG